jgi:hypothetical protein
MKQNKSYWICGLGYTIKFQTAKERNNFSSMVNSIYKKMVKDPKFTDINALYTSISKSVANHLNLKIS